MNVYAICVRRMNKNDYCIPMELEQIDELFLKYSKEQVLELLRTNDSVLNETDPNLLSIKKLVNGKYISLKYLDIINDHRLLDIPLYYFFKEEKSGSRYCHILYNHLHHLLNKSYVSEIFKQAIIALNESKESFLTSISSLSYSERRIIRLAIYPYVDISNLYDEYIM